MISQKKLREFQLGFSLVELVVVMGILGMMMGLGIPYIVQLRRSRQVESVAYEVRDVIKNARLKALAVSTERLDAWPTGYQVNIYTDEISLYPVGGTTSSFTEWKVEDLPFTAVPVYLIDPSGVTINPGNCSRVVFESVNGRMHIFDSADNEISGDCAVAFSLEGANRDLILNSSTKTFRVE